MSEKYVWIPDPGVVGRVLSQMLYGAVVQYNFGGLEFNEMLVDEDYEEMNLGTEENDE